MMNLTRTFKLRRLPAHACKHARWPLALGPSAARAPLGLQLALKLQRVVRAVPHGGELTVALPVAELGLRPSPESHGPGGSWPAVTLAAARTGSLRGVAAAIQLQVVQLACSTGRLAWPVALGEGPA